MARNNREVGREQKQESIISVACDLFLRQGYDDTSMAAIAKAAGVAPNTLYWYFKNKDDVLIAVLNRMILDGMTAHMAVTQKSATVQVLNLFSQFEHARYLVSAVHARLEQSEAIRTWHTQFHLLIENFFVAWLMARGLTQAKAGIVATAGVFIIEGLLSHPHTSIQKEQVLDWLVNIDQVDPS